MSRVLLASVGLIVAGLAQASAADIPPRQAYSPGAAVHRAYDWSGVYAGAHVGYGWSLWIADAAVGGTIVASDSARVSGFLGGVQLGINWQSGAMVYGLETDLTASGQKNTALIGGVTFSERVRWFGTTRARLGFASDRWMVYGTGGIAYTALQSDITVGGVTDAGRTTKMGWTVGAGFEHALGNNWTWRTEYLYIDAGRVTSTTGVVTNHFRARNNVARLGVNYKF